MASHFQWYPSSDQVIVPWNARYSYPSQANKAVKMTPRIPPKNGATFSPGSVIRLEFPAQGYVNPQNTTLEFDVTLTAPTFSGTGVGSYTRFQNNIQSIFNRVRLLYGSTPIEDVINYNVIVRSLTEWTGTNAFDQSSINEGIGGTVPTSLSIQSVVPTSTTTNTANVAANTVAKFVPGMTNARSAFIQGIDVPQVATTTFDRGIVPQGGVINGLTHTGGQSCTRRYQVQLALGLFTQEKLIPTKFMASQLAIELTLDQPAACIISVQNLNSQTIVSPATYSVSNVNLIPEILEFDASYDMMFLKGLQEGGVPLKFSSWHTYSFTTGGASNVNLLIQERSRSVKSLFCVQRRSPTNVNVDSHATFFDTSGVGGTTGGGTLQQFQFRIGGRYYPAAPVQCSQNVGSAISNGGAEAFVELQKALKQLGDYRLSSPMNTLRWAVPCATTTFPAGPSVLTALPETDFSTSIYQFSPFGNPLITSIEGCSTTSLLLGTIQAGNAGSGCFAMAVNLETTNGVEISGLNAEEQSDIALTANWASAQASGYALEVYTYYDAMIILRENNVLELIQ